MMHNLFPKHKVRLRVECSSREEALASCHGAEYQVKFWDYVKLQKDILERETRPIHRDAGRVIVENVKSRPVFYQGKPYAEFEVTLNLEDVFDTQFP